MGWEGQIMSYLLGQVRRRKETRELYLESDVFLFTGVIAKNGDRDGIPNVVPEAMSCRVSDFSLLLTPEHRRRLLKMFQAFH